MKKESVPGEYRACTERVRHHSCKSPTHKTRETPCVLATGSGSTTSGSATGSCALGGGSVDRGGGRVLVVTFGGGNVLVAARGAGSPFDARGAGSPVGARGAGSDEQASGCATSTGTAYDFGVDH